MQKLAILGGEKVKTTPYGSGNRFGEEELVQLKESLSQQTLFYWHGKKTKEMTAKFATMYGLKYCVAASSGTAALHVALGALGISPGDEVITSAITDLGSVIGILYQNAIPIFADVDPHTYNITAETIEKCVTERTKAIIVVHLAGNPADMDSIKRVADKYNLKIIEDCAQSYLSYYKGRLAGTIGDAGCFSLNDFKHISAGDGGMVLVKDEELYYKSLKFADKNYKRTEGANLREADFLAPNYRINELTSAVAIAQLDKLENICNKRNKYGDALTEQIQGLKGIYPHKITEGGKSSYWFYMLRINETELGASREEFVNALNAEGITAAAGYIQKCVYSYPMFLQKNFFHGSSLPFETRDYDKKANYANGMCPIAEEVLKTSVKLPVNEFFTKQDLEDTITAIKKVHKYFANR